MVPGPISTQIGGNFAQTGGQEHRRECMHGVTRKLYRVQPCGCIHSMSATVKQIKIVEGNAATIEAALREVNGRYGESKFVTYRQIEKCAEHGETTLDELGLFKCSRPGARLKATSGHEVPKSYNYKRPATEVVLERRDSGWYLVALARAVVYTQGGSKFVELTAEQDAEVVAKVRKRYQLVS